MRRILSILAVAFAMVAPLSAQTTAITATHIAQDVSGTLLASGKLCFVPVSQATGQVTGFEVSGVQYLPQSYCATVTAGAISGVTLPDTSLSSPVTGFRLSVTDSTGKALYNYPQPIFPFGTTWSLDTWTITESVVAANPTTVNRGNNAPQGRCGNAPALYYTQTNVYTCWDQIWLVVSSSGGGTITSAAITSALGFTPSSNTAIAAAIAAIPPLTSSNITTALTYTPASAADISTAIAAIPALNSTNIATALGYVPVSPSTLAASLPPTAAPPTFSPVAGTYTSTQTVTLSDTTSGASIFYCVNPTGNCNPNIMYSAVLTVPSTETICSSAQGSSGGVVSLVTCGTYTINSGTPPPITGNNIGTVARQGVMTDGSITFKTCYVGSSVCSGGVGSTAPSSTPTHVFGLNTPSANSGTSNAVGQFVLATATPAGAYTDALWTFSGGGLGTDSTSTNWYRDFWIRTHFKAGITNLEFDTAAFDDTWDYMWGTQCNGQSHLIQVDNQLVGWKNTSVPCASLYDGNWHHVTQTFSRDLPGSNNCSTAKDYHGGSTGPSGPAIGDTGNVAPCHSWDTMTIDDRSYAINMSLPAEHFLSFTTSNWTGSGGQWQLDISPTSASSGSPSSQSIDVDTDLVQAGSAAAGTNPSGGGGGSTTGIGELDSFNFDSGTPTSVGLTTVGSPTISTSNYHTSPNSASFPAGNNYFIDTLGAPTTTLYTRQYIYMTSIGTNSNSFLRLYHGGSEMFSFFFNASNGYPSVFNQASGVTTTMQATAYPTGSVHYIETYTKISATAGQIICKIDGTLVYTSATTLNTGTATVDTVWFGQIGGTAPAGWGTTYQDNVDFSASSFIGPI